MGEGQGDEGEKTGQVDVNDGKDRIAVQAGRDGGAFAPAGWMEVARACSHRSGAGHTGWLEENVSVTQGGHGPADNCFLPAAQSMVRGVRRGHGPVDSCFLFAEQPVVKGVGSGKG